MVNVVLRETAMWLGPNERKKQRTRTVNALLGSRP